MIDGRTLLQVNATVIIGVLFSLTISSIVGGTSERDAVFTSALFTTLTAAPFGTSAIMIMYANSLQQQSRPLSPVYIFQRNPRYGTKEERSRRIDFSLLIAETITTAGFLYIVITVCLIFVLALDQNYETPITEQCAQDPQRFGVNGSALWLCSMFHQDSLAELCTSDPVRFGVNISKCYKFIPPLSQSPVVTS